MEEKNTAMNPEELTEEQKAQNEIKEKIDQGILDFVKRTYESISPKIIFELFGQPDRYEAFAASAREYEAKVREINVKKAAAEAEGRTLSEEELALDPHTPWFEFLDDVPVSAVRVGHLLDQIIQMITQISVSSAQTVNNLIYDNVIGPQFANNQHNDEQFAHLFGDILRRVEALEKTCGAKANDAE